ncbi:hypothetical protein GVAV_002115 [Gurleya vavrai]
MPSESFFSHVEPDSDGNFKIDISQFNLEEEIELPDLLSYFFHTKETQVDKPNETNDSEKQQRRYFADTLVCYDCGETGHVNRKCPKRVSNVCILCSQKGHEKRNCPMMVCNKCYRCGHLSRNCEERDSRARYSLCRRCKLEHTERDCPMEWRQYFISGREEFKDILKSCCYCFKNDHFMDDCVKGRSRISIFNKDFKSCVRFNRN